MMETRCSFQVCSNLLKLLRINAVIEMKTPRCPECDEPAAVVEETVLAWTTLNYEGGNEFDWGGWTEPTDDSNEPTRYGSKVLLMCTSSHQWKSVFREVS
jgi:phage FluMu protein Com